MGSEDSQVSFRYVIKQVILAVVLGGGGYFAVTSIFDSSLLEKCLVIGKASKKEYKIFLDEGGLENLGINKVRGFNVDQLNISYGDDDKVIGYSLSFNRILSNTLPSPNSIKKAFENVCGSVWNDRLANYSNDVMCIVGDSSILIRKGK